MNIFHINWIWLTTMSIQWILLSMQLQPTQSIESPISLSHNSQRFRFRPISDQFTYCRHKYCVCTIPIKHETSERGLRHRKFVLTQTLKFQNKYKYRQLRLCRFINYITVNCHVPESKRILPIRANIALSENGTSNFSTGHWKFIIRRCKGIFLVKPAHLLTGRYFVVISAIRQVLTLFPQMSEKKLDRVARSPQNITSQQPVNSNTTFNSSSSSVNVTVQDTNLSISNITSASLISLSTSSSPILSISLSTTSSTPSLTSLSTSSSSLSLPTSSPPSILSSTTSTTTHSTADAVKSPELTTSATLDLTNVSTTTANNSSTGKHNFSSTSVPLTSQTSETISVTRTSLPVSIQTSQPTSKPTNGHSDTPSATYTTTTSVMFSDRDKHNFDVSEFTWLLLVVAMAKEASRPEVFGSFISLACCLLIFATCFLMWDKIKHLSCCKINSKSSSNFSSAQTDELQLTDSGCVSQNVSTSSNELLSSSLGITKMSDDVNTFVDKPLLETSLSLESLITSLSKNNQNVTLTISCSPTSDPNSPNHADVILGTPQDSNGTRKELSHSSGEGLREYSKFIASASQPLQEDHDYDVINDQDILDFTNNVNGLNSEYINVALPDSYSPFPTQNTDSGVLVSDSPVNSNYVNVENILVRGSTLRSSLV